MSVTFNSHNGKRMTGCQTFNAYLFFFVGSGVSAVMVIPEKYKRSPQVSLQLTIVLCISWILYN